MTAQINAIIAQYIANETRLIIPEVGTLIRRKESGEIVFMEMLKKNDGVLSGLIVNTLDVSPSKSAEILKRYTADIQKQLTSSKKFILDGVGVLLVRPEGGIDFSFNPFAQSIPEPTRATEEEPTVAKVETVEDKTASKAVVTEEKSAPEAKVPEPVAKPAPAPEEKEPEPVAKPAPAAKPAAPKPAVKPTPKPAVKAYDEDEAPRKPRISGRRQRVKIDGLTIVAIVAVIMALITLVWGFSTPEANEPLSMVDNTAIEVQSTPEAN